MEQPSSDLFVDDEQLKISRLILCQYFILQQNLFMSQLNAAYFCFKVSMKKKIFIFILVANFRRRPVW